MGWLEHKRSDYKGPKRAEEFGFEKNEIKQATRGNLSSSIGE